MFVKFLEEESQKKQPPLVARLPVRAMADEAQLRSSQRKLNSGQLLVGLTRADWEGYDFVN